MEHLPQQLQQALEGLTRPFSASQIRFFREDLSKRYREGKGVETPGHRVAYLAARFPATYGVISAVLKRLELDSIQSALDLGAGPGTGAWALKEHFLSLHQITCLERDAHFMALGKTLTTPLSGTSWFLQDLTKLSFAIPHDLVLISYVLGELKVEDRWPLVQKAFFLTQKLLLLIEPGTPEGYLRLMDLRQQLIQAGALIWAPCPHTYACPLQDKEGDWCHFATRLSRSALHRYAKDADLMWEDETYAYLIVSPPTYPPPSRPFFRILKPPRRHPGHIILDLCTPEGNRERKTLSKKDKIPFTAAKKATWGDIAKVK